MSVYNPPIENVPIFDAALFRDTNSETALTPAQADKRYLRFPIAQGNETLQDATIGGALIANSTASLNGVTTFNANTIINNQTLNINGASGQITYADNTTQKSAYSGAGNLAGSYTNTNMTIDSNGKITGLSNGTGGSSVNITPSSIVITSSPSYSPTAGITCAINNSAKLSFSGLGGANVGGVNNFCASTNVNFNFNIGGSTTPSNSFIIKYRITFSFWNSTNWGQTSCLIDFYPNRWTQGAITGNNLYNINNKINGNGNYVYTDATYAPNGRQFWTYQQQLSGQGTSSGLFIPHNGYWTLYFVIPDNSYYWSGCIEALDTTNANSNNYSVTLNT